MTRPAPAGPLLREWRQRRRLSQLELAGRAGTSTRHLSYVETGRAVPSRTMVLRLTETLEVPLRDINLVLLGAGHAPAFPDSRPHPQGLLSLLDGVLTGHLPHPALVLDADFDVVAANSAVDALLGLVTAPELLAPPVNVVRATLHPQGLAPYIGNLAAWRAHLLRQVRRHVDAAPSPALDALLADALAFPAPPEVDDGEPTYALPLELRIGPDRLRLYSTVATFGTPLDVATSELAIETFVPADEATRAWFTAR